MPNRAIIFNRLPSLIATQNVFIAAVFNDSRVGVNIAEKQELKVLKSFGSFTYCQHLLIIVISLLFLAFTIGRTTRETLEPAR